MPIPTKRALAQPNAITLRQRRGGCDFCVLAPEDEVVMPSFTFVSTANAVTLRGAILVL